MPVVNHLIESSNRAQEGRKKTIKDQEEKK
jgi:hypothetical protein